MGIKSLCFLHEDIYFLNNFTRGDSNSMGLEMSTTELIRQIHDS